MDPKSLKCPVGGKLENSPNFSAATSGCSFQIQRFSGESLNTCPNDKGPKVEHS